MPNGGGPRCWTSATTVIGLGGAGTRMLNAVQEMVTRADPDIPYSYLAVDSGTDDLERATEQATTVALETSTEHWDAHRESYGYLTGDTELPKAGGTARSRPLGRYCADSRENLDELINALDYAIETASKDTDADSGVHQVWIVHSLGGGTGSGLFPLVAALVRELTLGSDYQVVVGGIGSLPRLDRLEQTAIVPAGPDAFYLNTYTALRELAALTDYEDDDLYPITIQIESDTNRLATDELSVDESPFDVYGLLGATEEDLSDPSYREHKNRSAAASIYAFSQRALTPSPSNQNSPPVARGLGQWFGAKDPWNGERLFSIDAGGVHFPIDELDTYVDTTERITNVEEQIRDLEHDNEALSNAIQYLNGLLDWYPDSELTVVDETVFREVQYQARDHRHSNLDNISAGIESAVSSLRSELDSPERVDSEDAAIYVFARVLDRHLTEELDEHLFPELVDRMLEKYTETSEEERPDDPLACWQRVLEPRLSQRQDRIKEELNETTFRIFKQRDLRSTLDETSDDYNEVEQLATEYEKLRNAKDKARVRWEGTRSALRNQRNNLEERRDEKQRALSELDTDRKQLQNQRDNLRAVLETTRLGEKTLLPVVDPDSIKSGLLEDASGLEDLIERGVLEDNDIGEALKHELEGLEEPTQDRMFREDVMPSTAVMLLSNSQNHDLVARLDDAFDESGIPLSWTLDTFDQVDEVITATPFSVDLTATFAPIALENTSEFGTLHEYYTDTDRNLSDQFEDDITDQDVTNRFAYPELLN